MLKSPLAFEFSKTRTICDAFDEAVLWDKVGDGMRV
jgi:hypothetical protein